MIEKDRILLARMSRINQSLGQVVLELYDYQDGGELPPVGLRTLGTLLAELGTDMIARADELSRPIIDADGCDQKFADTDSAEMSDKP